MPSEKKWFINKMIGKTMLIITWAALAAVNMLCIQRMQRTEFEQWIALSLITFFIVIFIIDPILYWLLCLSMISNKDVKKVEFFTRGQYKNRRCSQIYVIFVIGREKLKDLKRKLNPIIKK